MPRKSEKFTETPKRKFIDELEMLASEAGVPFRRNEEHLELVIGGVESAVEFGAQQTIEAVKELRDELVTRIERLETQLGSISTALWILCAVSIISAAKVFLG
jgi:hypothetical protein